MSINTHEKCNSIPTDCIPIQQIINNLFKYLWHHNIQPANKIIIQNLDDFIKQQPYHIDLLISNYTLHTKSHSLLEYITNDISIYIYISTDGTREGIKWRWLAHCNRHRSTNRAWIQLWLRVVRRYTFVSIWSVYISCITSIHQYICRILPIKNNK